MRHRDHGTHQLLPVFPPSLCTRWGWCRMAYPHCRPRPRGQGRTALSPFVVALSLIVVWVLVAAPPVAYCPCLRHVFAWWDYLALCRVDLVVTNLAAGFLLVGLRMVLPPASPASLRMGRFPQKNLQTVASHLADRKLVNVLGRGHQTVTATAAAHFPARARQIHDVSAHRSAGCMLLRFQ
jgi:hypothetical protein